MKGMVRTKLGSVSKQASAELLAEDEHPEEGDDPQAALERLELPAFVELLAAIEPLAEDESPDEGDDPQADRSVLSSGPPLSSWQRLSRRPGMNSLTKTMICRQLGSISSSRPPLNS